MALVPVMAHQLAHGTPGTPGFHDSVILVVHKVGVWAWLDAFLIVTHCVAISSGIYHSGSWVLLAADSQSPRYARRLRQGSRAAGYRAHGSTEVRVRVRPMGPWRRVHPGHIGDASLQF